MKAGWERSNELIIPDIDIINSILKPFLKGKNVVQIQVLSGGLINSNIKMTTDTGENYVLRIYSKNNKSMDIERRIINLLKDVVPVPQVFYSESFSAVINHPFLILDWVKGSQLSEIIYKGNKRAISSAASAVGEALAQIHKMKFPASGFFDENLNISDYIKLDASKFLMYIEENLMRGHADRHLGTELCGKILRFAQAHADLIDKLGEQNSLVHSDFNPLNILVNEKDGHVNIAAILDWEYAFSGSSLTDIGNMLRYENVASGELLRPFIVSYKDSGGYLPVKWLQKAKLLDLIALCQLLNKEECGAVRIMDIKRLIISTMEEWNLYEPVQAEFCEMKEEII